MTKKQLFELLIKCNYKKTVHDDHFFFKNREELIVFPKGKLSSSRMLSTLVQLYVGGKIKERKFKTMIKNG